MHPDDFRFWSILKAELLREFHQANPYFNGGWEDFGGREIVLFQNDLQEKTGGRVSEKWFYTHLKKEHHRLPRIDVLDLLSKYAVQDDWSGFKKSMHSLPSSKPKRQIPLQKGRSMVGLFILLCILSGIAMISDIDFNYERNYQACFVDAWTAHPLGQNVEVLQIHQNESPELFSPDEYGCIQLKSNSPQLSFIVKGKYLHTDTITRTLRHKTIMETIPVRRDDQAWMIHLLSKGGKQAWESRRIQLDRMIADDAFIFQIDVESGQAMELLNKKEFINKLTLPVRSLAALEIIQAERNKKGQIRLLRFYQKK